MRTLGRLLLLASLSTGVACGVPAEDDPRELSAERVPFDLLEPASTTPSSTVPETGRLTTVDVFLVRSQRLAPGQREVPAPASPEGVIGALLEGPTQAESDAGLATAIPDGTVLIDASQSGRVLTLNLSVDINTVQAEVQTQAIAQLVYTATGLQRVEGVRFEVAGEPTEVPIGDGSLEGRPIRRSDYPELDPARPPA